MQMPTKAEAVFFVNRNIIEYCFWLTASLQNLERILLLYYLVPKSRNNSLIVQQKRFAHWCNEL